LYAKKKTFLLFGSPIATTYNNNNNNTTTTNMETNAFFGGLTKKKSGTRAVGRKGPWWTLFWNVLLSENGQS